MNGEFDKGEVDEKKDTSNIEKENKASEGLIVGGSGNWKVVCTEEKGRIYYYNVKTKEKSWGPVCYSEKI
jgi:hypothetical protein